MKRHVILTFLLMLYIVPLFLMPSYGPYTILAQPNMNKEFSSSEYGDESPYSITSFSETLPDDVLFYPDAINSDIIVASDGVGDWEDSLTINSVTWSAYHDREYANFSISDFAIESITYSFLACGYTGDGYLSLWNSTDWVALETFLDNGTDQIEVWYNATISTDPNQYVIDGAVLQFGIIGDGGFGYATVDYAQILVSYMTLKDSEHYADGFTDVSDWEQINCEGADSFTTDNDALFWYMNNNGNPDSDYLQINSISLPSGQYYAEIRYLYNTSSTVQNLLYSTTLDDRAGTGTQLISLTRTSNTWATLKAYFSVTAVECIYFYHGFSTHPDGLFKIDYLRISPANESGWQHDGSVTDGVIDSVYGGTVSSDGDYLSLIADADFSVFNFSIDTTSTQASYLPTYYPFLKIAINPSDVGNDLRLRVGYYDGSWNTLVNQFTTTQAIMYFNIRATSANAIRTIQLYGYSSQTTRVDYIKAYSIANFTISQHASTTVNDYYYVNDDNDLVRVASNAWYIEMNHDPAISVDTSLYTACTIAYSGLTSTGGSSDYGLYTYIDGAGSWTYDESQFLLDSGTMTDFRIVTSSSITISAITFWDSHQWQEVDAVTVFIRVPFDYWAVDMALILIGLAMAVFSTCYIAYKVTYDKNNLNLQTGLIVILLFMFGWGLFFGGIF